jgi:hypothetical protein
MTTPREVRAENIAKIEEFFTDFRNRIVNSHPIHPLEWQDVAMQILILSESVDDQIIEAETAMAEEEMRLISEGKSAAASKMLKAKAVHYGDYLRAKALHNRIEEFIRLAKKRAEVEMYHP